MDEPEDIFKEANMAKKTIFDTLYGAGEAAIQTIQKPSRMKMIRRVAERIEDDVNDKRVQAELKITDLRHRLVNTKDEKEAEDIYRQIVAERLTVEEAAKTAQDVIAERDFIFSPASEDAIAEGDK